MLSTWGAGQDRVRGLDLKGEDYLTEPFGIEELMERIEKIFHRDCDASPLVHAS